jgi:transposase-like protein
LKNSKGGLELDSREVVQKYRLNQWAAIIRECRSSGQTVAAWCKDHNVNLKSYYYWLKRVRTAACEALPVLNSDNNFIVPVNLQNPTAAAGSVDQKSTPAMVIRHGSITLEISNSASATLIENMLKALQYVR